MSLRKTLILACAASVLGLGSAAMAQTDPMATPAAPAAGAAPMSSDAPAPKPMMKKHMAKKHMKKKMMKKM